MTEDTAMKDAIRQELARIHGAASRGDMQEVNDALTAIERLIERTPMPVRLKEPPKGKKRKAA